jgi:nucleoid DNA-binding protein
MNKGDLVSKIQEDAGISKSQAENALNAVLDGITNALENDDSVTLVGFGTFSVNKRDARQGRNPQTGETIKIAAKNVVKFKAGKKLNESVNS